MLCDLLKPCSRYWVQRHAGALQPRRLAAGGTRAPAITDHSSESEKNNKC